MSAWGLLIRALAAYRLTELIASDQISRPLRQKIGSRWPGSLGYLVQCRACVSVWAGLALASGKVPPKVEQGLAASATVLLADRMIEIAESAVVAVNRR
jgi:hypothetical protein